MKLKVGACDSDYDALVGTLYNNCPSLTGADCTGPCRLCPNNNNICALVTEPCPANPDAQCTSGDCCDVYNNFKPSTVICREAAGPCDEPEYCTGSSGTCPTNKFKSKSVKCRAAEGDCDVDDYCTGSSASCPNKFKAKTVVCRAAEGDCDKPEYCTGSSKDCPSDSVQPNTYVCRAAVNSVCDVPEYCDGINKSCPKNVVKPTTTVCRTATNQCESDSYCTSSGSCQPTQYKPKGTKCNDGNSKTENDICLGDGQCVGEFKGECKADSDCTTSNVCQTGKCTNKQCVYTKVADNSVICRDKANVCDYVEYCSNGLCPEDLKNKTCLDELSANANVIKSKKRGFPGYAIALIVIAAVVFIVVAVFVAYRIKKNYDEFEDEPDIENDKSEETSFENPAPKPNRFSLARPISIRIPPSSQPQAYQPLSNAYTRPQPPRPQPYQQTRPQPQPQPYQQTRPQPQPQPYQQTRPQPPLPNRTKRVSVRVRPVSTRMRAPAVPPANSPTANFGRRPMPAPQQGSGRPMPQNPQRSGRRPMPAPQQGSGMPQNPQRSGRRPMPAPQQGSGRPMPQNPQRSGRRPMPAPRG